MNPQEKPNILEYQDVVKRPNPMVNINPLARGSGKVVTLEDRLTKLKKAKVWQKQMQLWRNRDHKFDMARMPRVEMVHLGDILIDEDIQRQLDEKHCANKICNINLFDPALLQTLQCIKRNDGQFVSIDGQHTGSVIAGLIDEGFIKGDWKIFEFPVQFIETDDLAFARRAFQTLNGKGKKKQSAYQSLRNDVFIVRIDKQGDEEEIATENQVAIAERNECYPVEENSDLLKYPGTFTNIATFKTMTDDETEMACSWHNKYFHYIDIHTALFFIFRDLNREFDSAKMKITNDLQFELAGLIQNLFGDLKQFAESTKEAHRRWGEKRYGYPPKWDDDAYMCGLIGLYQYFKGKESVPPSILDRMDDLVDFYDEDILRLAD